MVPLHLHITFCSYPKVAIWNTKLVYTDQTLLDAQLFVFALPRHFWVAAVIASAFLSVVKCWAGILICKLWSCDDLCGLQISMTAKRLLFKINFISYISVLLKTLFSNFFICQVAHLIFGLNEYLNFP